MMLNMKSLKGALLGIAAIALFSQNKTLADDAALIRQAADQALRPASATAQVSGPPSQARLGNSGSQQTELAALTARMQWITRELHTLQGKLGIQGECAELAVSRSLPTEAATSDATQTAARNACVDPQVVAQMPNFGRPSARGATTVHQMQFLQYMIPLAAMVQANTGFPSSVLIAQAIKETGWGTSLGFRARKSLFGLSCTWRDYGKSKVYPVRVAGKLVHVTGRCIARRPAGEGGYYMVFASPLDSVYAYIYNTFQSPSSNRHFAGLRATLERANPGMIYGNLSQVTYKPAPYQQVVEGLRSYATDPHYRSGLLDLIRRQRLDVFDRMAFCRE